MQSGTWLSLSQLNCAHYRTESYNHWSIQWRCSFTTSSDLSIRAP
ncbi:Uncharacterised protein [Vibrio cholerae]|nr:Uncharacterised protein [Vibrio cholerae]